LDNHVKECKYQGGMPEWFKKYANSRKMYFTDCATLPLEVRLILNNKCNKDTLKKLVVGD